MSSILQWRHQGAPLRNSWGPPWSARCRPDRSALDLAAEKPAMVERVPGYLRPGGSPCRCWGTTRVFSMFDRRGLELAAENPALAHASALRGCVTDVWIAPCDHSMLACSCRSWRPRRALLLCRCYEQYSLSGTFSSGRHLSVLRDGWLFVASAHGRVAILCGQMVTL